METLQKTNAGQTKEVIHLPIGELVKRFSLLLKRYDVLINAYTPYSLSHFYNLPLGKQQEIYNNFKYYSDFCYEIHNSGVSLKDNVKTLRAAFNTLKMRTSDSFLTNIVDTDLIEIYNMEGRQIFRNFRLFEMSSLSLLELISNEWPELFERSLDVTEHIHKHITQALSGQQDLISMENVPTHLMRERMTDVKIAHFVNFKFIAPVYTGPEKIENFIISSGSKKVEDDYNYSNISFI
ncbi:MAG: hypothetical protein HOO06_02545 [Bdellovibrionaceae bacterium]|jgi:hypothetical protein|nr:hypothetical protein [Pseudobdellovibrionaceae bacterium]